MEIVKGDYVEGFEYYGGVTIRKTKGWVNNIGTFNGHICYDIQADDDWNGARGTTLFTELGEVKKLENKPRPE